MARRRVTAWLGRLIRPLHRVGGRGLLESDAARVVRRRLVSTSEREVLEVVDALDGAGVNAWLAGGWGVDALLGGRARTHNDIDFVLDARDDSVGAALDALAALGISHIDEDAVGGRYMPVLVEVTDRSGRVVDLCPVDVDALPAAAPFADGTLGGRTVRCLSPELQVAFHRGYRQRASQRSDLRRLCRKFGLAMPTEPPSRLARRARRLRVTMSSVARRLFRHRARLVSALLIPVLEAGDAMALGHAGAAQSASAGVPPHVTVLYPFVPPDRIDREVDHRVSEVASSFPPFVFRLDRVGRFPGVVYLAPEPEEPFVEMTRTFSRYWPEHPPYEGAYPDTIPHLTVVDGDEPEGVADALSELVPIPARATELWLMVEGEHGWGLHGRYPLGGTERD